ncbi:MAG: biotin transporter BioY [Anaerobutyricum hallii]|uniref:biotin transporter BioY n=1 Tax=Lachnospiraceae TaxID=186803 RepID=UPI00321B344D
MTHILRKAFFRHALEKYFLHSNYFTVLFPLCLPQIYYYGNYNVADYTFKAAFAVCVIPFIPVDLVKMLIAIIIESVIKKRIR